MLAVILTCLAVFLLLIVNEWWWRARQHGEISRKAVHISVGSFVALWPLYLSWQQIELLSLAFVVVIILSRWLKVFQAIHSVQRPTWGEIYFGVSVGLIAFMTHSPAVYAAALLHMSLADGLAAIVGVKYGARYAYSVLGSRKSVAGSLTFFVCSLAILTAFCFNQHIGFTFVLGLTAVAATIVENIAVRGLDNVLIPVLVAVVLSAVH